MHQNPGVKRKFTGSHGHLVMPSTFEKASSVVHRDTLAAPVDTAKPVKYQDAGKLCALNSVANGVQIPQALYDDLSRKTNRSSK